MKRADWVEFIRDELEISPDYSLTGAVTLSSLKADALDVIEIIETVERHFGCGRLDLEVDYVAEPDLTAFKLIDSKGHDWPVTTVEQLAAVFEAIQPNVPADQL